MDKIDDSKKKQSTTNGSGNIVSKPDKKDEIENMDNPPKANEVASILKLKRTKKNFFYKAGCYDR